MEQLIIDFIKKTVPSIKDVKFSDVPFSSEEIQRLGANPPSVTIYDISTRNHAIGGCRKTYDNLYRAYIVASRDACGDCTSAKDISIKLANNLTGGLTTRDYTVESGTIITQNFTDQLEPDSGLAMQGLRWEIKVTQKQEI